MHLHRGPILETWRWEKFILQEDGTELVIESSSEMRNLQVDGGRALVEAYMGGMTGVDAASAVPYIMLGASSTEPAYTDTRLGYEYNNNATRFTFVGNVSGLYPPTRADIVLDPVVVDDVTYRQKMVWKFTIPASDGLDGLVIQEAGLNTEEATPGSPSATHGVMFCRLSMAEEPLTKQAGIPANIYFTTYF